MSLDFNRKKRKNSFDFCSNFLEFDSETKETRDSLCQSNIISYKSIFKSKRIINNIDLTTYDYMFIGRTIHNISLEDFSSFKKLLNNIKNTFNPKLLQNNINIEDISQKGKFSFTNNNLTEIIPINKKDKKFVEISINNKYIKAKSGKTYYNFYATKSFFKGKHCFEIEILNTKIEVSIGIININNLDILLDDVNKANNYYIFHQNIIHIYKIEKQYFLKKENTVYIHYLTCNDTFGFCYDLNKKLFHLFLNGELINTSILKIDLSENDSYAPFIRMGNFDEIIFNPGDELKYGKNYSSYEFIPLDEFGDNNYELSNLRKITDDYLDILLNDVKLLIKDNNISYSDINQLFHIMFNFLGKYSFRQSYIICKSLIKKYFFEKKIINEEFEIFYICLKYILNSSRKSKSVIKTIFLNIEETIYIYFRRGNSENSYAIKNLIQFFKFLLFKKDIQTILSEISKTLIKIFKKIFISFNIYNEYCKDNHLDIETGKNLEQVSNQKKKNSNLISSILKTSCITFEDIFFSNQIIFIKTNPPNYLSELIENILFNGIDGQSKFIYKIFKNFINKRINNYNLERKKFCNLLKTIYIPLMKSFNNEYSKGKKIHIKIKKYFNNNDLFGEGLGGNIDNVFLKYAKNNQNFQELMNLEIKDINSFFLIEFLSFFYKKRLSTHFWDKLNSTIDKTKRYYFSIFSSNETLNNLEIIHEKISRLIKYKFFYFNREDLNVLVEFLLNIGHFILNELYPKKLVYFLPKSLFNNIEKVISINKEIIELCQRSQKYLFLKGKKKVNINNTINEIFNFYDNLRELCNQCCRQYLSIYIKIINDENINDSLIKNSYLQTLIENLSYDKFYTNDDYNYIFNFITSANNKSEYKSSISSFIQTFQNSVDKEFGKRLSLLLSKNPNFLKIVIIILYEDIDSKLSKLEESFSEYHFIQRDSQNSNLINRENFHQNIIYSKTNNVIVINGNDNSEQLMNQNHIEMLNNALLPLGENRLVIISDLKDINFDDKNKLNKLIYALIRFNSEFTKIKDFYRVASKLKELYQNNSFVFKKLYNLLLSLNRLLFSKNNVAKIEYNNKENNEKNRINNFDNIIDSYTVLLQNLYEFYIILINNINEINDINILKELSKLINLNNFKANLKIMEKYNPPSKDVDYKTIKDFITILEKLKLDEEAKKQSNAQQNEINKENENNNICLICSDAAADSHISPCGHPICKNCLLQHSLESKTCPFCREEMKGIKEDPNFKI